MHIIITPSGPICNDFMLYLLWENEAGYVTVGIFTDTLKGNSKFLKIRGYHYFFTVEMLMRIFLVSYC